MSDIWRGFELLSPLEEKISRQKELFRFFAGKEKELFVQNREGSWTVFAYQSLSMSNIQIGNAYSGDVYWPSLTFKVVARLEGNYTYGGETIDWDDLSSLEIIPRKDYPRYLAGAFVSTDFTERLKG